MMTFELYCMHCDKYLDLEKSTLFIRGSKLIHDQLVYVCVYCGNKHENIIVWPLNLHGG